MVNAVVFDLYETLVTQSGTVVPRGGALGESLGLDARAYRREWKQLRPLMLRGELTFQQALLEIGMRLGVAIHVESVQRASDERTRANAAVFQKAKPELVALTCDLCALGLRLATISNCIAEDVAAWPESAFAPQFQCAVFSYAARMVKPDPRVYLEAVKQLGVRPADALYIGDGPDDELAGAERAGLRAAQAAWFVPPVASSAVPVLGSCHDVMPLVSLWRDG